MIKGRDNTTIEQHLKAFLNVEKALYEKILDSKAAYHFNQIVIAALSTEEKEIKNDFLSKCLRGEADISEVDVYIARWHNSKSKQKLHEYLGLTWEEYLDFVAHASALKDILSQRRKRELQ